MRRSILVGLGVSVPILLVLLYRVWNSTPEESWVGKWLIPTEADVRIQGSNPKDGETDGLVLTHASYQVIAEDSSRIKIRQNGAEGWIRKNQAVLASKAVDYFTARLRQNRFDAGMYQRRAEALLLGGDLDGAIRDLNEAVRLVPLSKEAVVHRGAVWQVKKDYENALRDYGAAIRLDAKFALAFASRGAVWHELREYDKAISDFDEAVRLDPAFLEAFVDRAIAWNAKKEYDKSVHDYDEGVRLAPRFADAFFGRGTAWMGLKDYDKAVRDFDEAVRLDPMQANSFVNRGGAWYFKKNYDQALGDIDEALRLAPTLVPALNAKAWLLATCPDEKFRDGKKAVELATRSCELSEWKIAACLGTLGAAYAEAGDFAKAIDWQTKALVDAEYEKEYGKDSRKRLELYQDGKPYRDE